jgi:hypothetical protein
MDDKDLYKGFAPEKQAEYEDWLVDNYGPEMRERIEASKAKLAEVGPEGIKAAMAEGQAAEDALVERFRAAIDPASPELDPALDSHRAWVGRMWDRECPRTAYGGLADMYLAHPDFRARYEARGEGFTDWLVAAMKAYAARLT